MSYEFYYTNTKTFDSPSASQPIGAITTYLKATKEEHALLKGFVTEIYNVMLSDYSEDETMANTVYGQVLTQHKMKSGLYYTVANAVVDLYDQLQKKDATESMVNRWNTAFTLLGLDDGCIHEVQGKRPPVNKAPKLPNHLFEVQE